MAVHSSIAGRIGAVALLLSASTLYSGEALAWGHTGHLQIGAVAMMSLPRSAPAFLRSQAAIDAVSELAAEADVSKSSGDATTPGQDVHDFERDAGHFIDFDDAGYVSPVSGFPQVQALRVDTLLAPAQGRRDFDTLLRANSGATVATQYTGYLPFNLTDHWQQIRKDFAYVRSFTAAIANPSTAPADRAFFARQLELRKRLTVRDIGYWAHFVGDASQPMHVSIHFNGWGANFPNPNGYTLSGIHADFEGYFVKNNIDMSEVAAAVGKYASCESVTGLAACAGIEPRVRHYLQQTLDQTIPLYELTKTLGNGNPWHTTTPTAEQKAFVVARLAAGAQEMRDELVDAWNSAGTISVGFPLKKVADIESGAVVWTASAFAGD